MKRLRDYRILDKDLQRVSNAEFASAQFFRPQIRLGIAIALIAVVGLATFGALGASADFTALAIGAAVAAYMALSMGGNDAANSLGPVVGVRAIGLNTGLVLVGLMQVGGAVFASHDVTERLASGIVVIDLSLDQGQAARIMIAALLAAAIWVSLATWVEATVSTTHAVVGGIAGAGVAVLGRDALNLSSLGTIASGWLLSPLIAGALAALLLALLRLTVIDSKDPRQGATTWIPPMIGLLAGLFTFHVLANCLNVDRGISLALALAAALLSLAWTHIDLRRQIARSDSVHDVAKAVLRLPLIVSALLMAFAHGSNDTSNITAPLSIILDSTDLTDARILGWTPLLAGLGIAAGTVLFGRRLVHMMGSKITRLNSGRAFCVTLATAITVIGASAAGLPVSTTHVAVGGVFGVGFYREWRDRRMSRQRAALPTEETRRRHLIRRSHVRTIFGAWLVTVPISAGLAALAVAVIP